METLVKPRPRRREAGAPPPPILFANEGGGDDDGGEGPGWLVLLGGILLTFWVMKKLTEPPAPRVIH